MPGKGPKYWGLKGANKDNVYSLGVQKGKSVFWCEGEMDALLCYSHGFPSITLTNGIGATEREDTYAQVTTLAFLVSL
jgi:hypothetical protein